MEALFRAAGSIIQNRFRASGNGAPHTARIAPPNSRNKKVKSRKIKRHGPDFMEVIRNSINNATSSEEGVRSKLLDSFLKASHGDLETFGRLHLQALEKDPIFYGHLARWYQTNGTIRDHHELFCAHLLTSPFPEHRAHGTVLMQYLRPYQTARVVRYCKEVLHFSTRALKSAVTFYLRRREADPLWFDEHVIRRRDSLKYLYSTLHIKAGERAHKVLFQDDPPADSRVSIARQLKKLAERPEEQARLIVKNRIHYTACVGAITHYTPAVLYALACVMTPPQVINNLKFFERRGALDHPDTRKVVEEKLRYGTEESRVSDFKSMVALSKLNASTDLARELMAITATRIKNRGEIKVPTALFVDKSGSMQSCIEIGKLLATMCSSIATAELYVYAFDTNTFEIKCKDSEFASWERAFAPIRAQNGTSIGAPFSRLKDKEVEQIVVISDGEHNSPPSFSTMLEQYEKAHKRQVRVIFVKVSPAPTPFVRAQSQALTPLETEMAGKDFTVINFNGDYYNLPNVIPLLCSGNNFELVEEVLAKELYTKEALNSLPVQFNAETFEVL